MASRPHALSTTVSGSGSLPSILVALGLTWTLLFACRGAHSGADQDAGANSNNSGDPDAYVAQVGDLGLVDFTLAGFPGGIPDVTENVIDVTEQGAQCNGTSDDSAELQAIIDAAGDPAVVLLPAGTCRITTRLNLPSGIVLRGRGSETTTPRAAVTGDRATA